MRAIVLAATLLSCCPAVPAQDTPAWLSDPKGFCSELARRANRITNPVPPAKPRLTRFIDYPAVRVAPARTQPGILGKNDWSDDHLFRQEVKAEAAKGPDFAGSYAILQWSCGTWCSNATIAGVRTGKTYDTPFVGVIGCTGVTGELNTLERHADSSLLVVRGSLEMSLGNSFNGGPCGVFYFRWIPNHLRLIGCDIPKRESAAER